MYSPTENYVRLPLPHVENIRDLGGYPASNGKATRFHAFLRSGDPGRMTPEEIQFIKDYGVSTVIDLRTEFEINRSPNELAGISGLDCLHIPLFIEDPIRFAYDKNDMEAMFKMYIYILDECPQNMKKLFQAICQAKEGGILFHCSAGKDRTGITAAFVLSLAGVSDLDIIANYQITDTYYMPYARAHYKNFDDIPIQYFQSRAESMANMLAHVHEKYGTVEDYLLKVGITPAEIETIRKRIL